MINLNKVSYEVGGRQVLSDVSFGINAGDRIGLVGPNGVGKTTLLHLINRDIIPTSGQITYDQTEIGMLPQDLNGWLDHTIEGFVASVTGVEKASDNFDSACKKLEEDQSEHTLMIYSEALEQYNRLDIGGFESRVKLAMANAGIANVDIYREIGTLSGGQKRRVALAAVIASMYDTILLDEPTNDLDTRGVTILEKFIGESPASFVIVSHDRQFLRNTSTRIIELLGDGVKQFNLGYDEYVEARRADKEATAKAYNQYEMEKKRLRRAARDANIRANSAAGNRRTPDSDKLTANARRERAAGHLAGAATAMSSRLSSLEEPERPEEEIRLAFAFATEERDKGATLLDVRDLSMEIYGRTVGPISMHLRAGDKVLLEGENGIGKTTLLKAIVNQSGSDSGESRIGSAARVIYIDQNQTLPTPDKTALENLQQLVSGLEKHDLINLLIRFGIKKDSLVVPARDLSGGERMKVLLASIAANRANLLIMDEPTNNLDIPTVEAVESALENYSGAILLVSHDREFVEAVNPEQKISLS